MTGSLLKDFAGFKSRCLPRAEAIPNCFCSVSALAEFVCSANGARAFATPLNLRGRWPAPGSWRNIFILRFLRFQFGPQYCFSLTGESESRWSASRPSVSRALPLRLVPTNDSRYLFGNDRANHRRALLQQGRKAHALALWTWPWVISHLFVFGLWRERQTLLESFVASATCAACRRKFAVCAVFIC